MVENPKIGDKVKLGMVKNLTQIYVEEIYFQGVKPQLVDQGKDLCKNIHKLIKNESFKKPS
mgnify:FL=1